MQIFFLSKNLDLKKKKKFPQKYYAALHIKQVSTAF